MKKIYISNAFFIPNIIVFIVTIGINIGAGNLFHPLNYTAGRFFRRKKSKAAYVNYADFIEQKKVESKDYWYISLAALVFLIVAFIFTF